MPYTISLKEQEARVDRAASQPQITIENEGGWERRAACGAHDPEMWAADARDIDAMRAREICRDECPVISYCRAKRYAIGGTGTWAGVTYRLGTQGTKTCARHGCEKPPLNYKAAYCSFECNHADHVGTRTGWNLHNKYRVPMCSQCSPQDPRYGQKSRGAIITKEEAYRIPGTTRRGGLAPAYNAHV